MSATIRFLRWAPLLRSAVYGIQRARCAEIIGRFESSLGGGPILDVGAGTCNGTELLLERGLEVTPLDVVDISFIPSIQPVLYDGITMPFDDDTFELALILTVLHHAKDPDAVLREARRVAKRVIVVEDVIRGPVHGFFTAAWDSLMNLEFIGHPHNNRTDASWLESFEAAGLRLEHREDLWSFLIMWQVTYMLERA
jgi:SAM-dependent methyltransferase